MGRRFTCATYISRNLSKFLGVREGEGIDLSSIYFTGDDTENGINTRVR